MHALEKVSVIVSMESYPSEIGNLTMKSMATEVNGRVKLSDGIGNSGGFGLVGLFFRD